MKKILVTFVEAGYGHIVSAQAILDALRAAGTDDVEIIDKDIFHENPELDKYEKFLIKQTKSGSSNPLHFPMLFALMRIIGSQNTLKLVHSTIYGKYVKMYIEELKKIKPDVIVDTHYFTSYVSTLYRDKYAPGCKVITYNPDNNVHGWWNIKVDCFIVNNDIAYEQALKAKFSEKQLLQINFPVRRDLLHADESKQFYRDKYGIPRDKFAVKVADGAYASAKAGKFIAELVKTKKPLTIVAIAGKNKKLYDKLMAMKDELPSDITLMPFGFVKDIHELFGACDLFISKAGPNALLDSAFMNTPIMVNYWASKIEWTANCLFIDRLGCGVTVKNAKKARLFVESCIDDPSILDKYIENEKKIDKNKNGAVEAAAFILEKVKE